jgi:hypothetical protein
MCPFLATYTKLRKATVSFVMSCLYVCLSVRLSLCPYVRPSVRLSVRMEQHGSHWTDFHEIWYLSVFFRKSANKIKIKLKYDKKTVLYTITNTYFRLYIAQFFPRMRNVSDKFVEPMKNTHFIFNNFCFENLTVHEVKWKIIIQPNRPQMKIRRMRIACWLPKATNT